MTPEIKEAIARGFGWLGSVLGVFPVLIGISYYLPRLITLLVQITPGWRGNLSSILVVLGTMILLFVLYQLVYTQVYKWTKMILK